MTDDGVLTPEIVRRLVDQVDDLAKGRIERNAEIYRLRAALSLAERRLDAAVKGLERADTELGPLANNKPGHIAWYLRRFIRTTLDEIEKMATPQQS